jgi:uncharacterized protein involved in exopolysaccharide biosynthesis
MLSLDTVPELAGEYAGLYMDLQVQEAKYNVLATRLEQTKIEESRSLPSFEILDHARIPHRKSGPNRTLTVLAALAVGLVSGILLALLLEDLEHRMDPATRSELAAFLPRFLARRRPAPSERER